MTTPITSIAEMTLTFSVESIDEQYRESFSEDGLFSLEYLAPLCSFFIEENDKRDKTHYASKIQRTADPGLIEVNIVFLSNAEDLLLSLGGYEALFRLSYDDQYTNMPIAQVPFIKTELLPN